MEDNIERALRMKERHRRKIKKRKGDVRYRMCKRKNGHATKEGALRHIAIIKEDKRKHLLVPYRCYFCGDWHIGHNKH